ATPSPPPSPRGRGKRDFSPTLSHGERLSQRAAVDREVAVHDAGVVEALGHGGCLRRNDLGRELRLGEQPRDLLGEMARVPRASQALSSRRNTSGKASMRTSWPFTSWKCPTKATIRSSGSPSARRASALSQRCSLSLSTRFGITVTRAGS